MSAALLSCGASISLAQAVHARVDVASTKQNPFILEILSSSKGARVEWHGSDWTQILSRFPVSNNRWQEGSFSFKPEKSGLVSLSINGPWIQSDPATKELQVVMIDFDDFQVEGALLQNAGFEESAPFGEVKHWYKVNVSTSNPPIDARNRARLMEGDAPEGTSFARVWHNSRLAQTIHVKEGVPVSVTFRYRLAE